MRWRFEIDLREVNSDEINNFDSLRLGTLYFVPVFAPVT